MKRDITTPDVTSSTTLANSASHSVSYPALGYEAPPSYRSPGTISEDLPQNVPLDAAYPHRNKDDMHLDNGVVDAKSVVELSREDYYCIRCIKFCFRKPKLKYWHFVTGLCTTNPKTLPIIRSLFAVYILACYIVYMTTDDSTRPITKDQSFFFLTILGFIALWLYFVLMSWYSWTYARDPKGFIMRGGAKSNLFHTLLQILYSLNVPIHLLISVVYWTLLAKEHYESGKFRTVDQWLNISSHGLTLIMLVTEIALNQMRFYFCHILAFLVAGLIYSIWTIVGAFVYKNDNGELWKVYTILDLSKPQVGYWYLALFGFGVTSYLFTILIHHLKYRYIKTRSRSILFTDENGDVEAQGSDHSSKCVPLHTCQKNETSASLEAIYPVA